MPPGCSSPPQVRPEAKTTTGWPYSMGLASVKLGADLWCSNSVETSGVFQRDCNWVVMDSGARFCAPAHQIAPASTHRSRVPTMAWSCLLLLTMAWSYPGCLLSQTSPTNNGDILGDMQHQGVCRRRSLCPLSAVVARVSGWK